MLTYMDYVQRCFYESTGWDEDMSYENILRTPSNLLSFSVPAGVKFSVSSKNTEHSYSSMTLSQLSRLNGSLSYLFASIDLKDSYLSSGTVPLQAVFNDYRFVRSPEQQRNYLAACQKAQKNLIAAKPYLLYGKMYFPSQFLEGMVIQRLTPNVQLMMKFIDTPKLKKMANTSTILTLYLQRQNENTSTDFIFSTNEALMGTRCLYKLGSDWATQDKTYPHIPQSSALSLGFELWFALRSMSPGLSGAARYTSNLSSGKPFNMTLALNPLLGTIESTYAVKTSLSSALCSKYTFNIYSYESDLLFGCSFLRCAADPDVPPVTRAAAQAESPDSPRPDYAELPEDEKFNQMDQKQQQKMLNTFMGMDKVVTETNARNFMQEFAASKWQSSFKASASLAKRDIHIAWEGRWKDILVSSGVSLDYSSEFQPKIGKYGLELQFSS